MRHWKIASVVKDVRNLEALCEVSAMVYVRIIYVSTHQLGRGISMEEMPSSDWSTGKSVEHLLD